MALNLRRLLGKVTNGVELAGYAHMAQSAFAAMKGKDLPAGAPAISQGILGVAGWGDERIMQTLFMRLTPNERQLMVGFNNWHFAGNTTQERLRAWWYESSFRVFVAGMKNADSSGKKTTVTTSDVAGVKTVETVEHDLQGNPHEHALNFLKHTIVIIKEGRNAAKRANPAITNEAALEAGYNYLLQYFNATGVPYIPPQTTNDWAQWAEALGLKSLRFAEDKFGKFQAGVATAYASRETKKGQRSLGRRIFDYFTI